ncbi:DUF3102 domain-containing protein [Cyanosarcina cf. burmensis CCALA 770]|jgi:hypothetical protein|nr:DUF3102 domain-containing protein [Cyanosarcina cf. burmensis CCALA 770]
MIAREVSCECLSSEFSNRLHNVCHKFDYAALDSGTRLIAQEHAREIKSLLRQSADNVFQIGQNLIDVKQSLPHGYFRKWIDSEFNWSESAARKFMQVARQFKSVKITDLNITPTALYALASKSVPERARDEAIARARQGEVIECGVAKEIIDRHKQFVPSTERMTIDIDSSQTVDVSAKVVREPELEPIELLADLQLDDPVPIDNSSEQMITRLLDSDSSSNKSILANLLDNFSHTSDEILLVAESETSEMLGIEVTEPITMLGSADTDVTGNSFVASIESISYEQIADSLAAIAHCMQLKTYDSANSVNEDILISIVERSQFLTESAKCLLEQKYSQD